jgi:hypothetical protein
MELGEVPAFAIGRNDGHMGKRMKNEQLLSLRDERRARVMGHDAHLLVRPHHRTPAAASLCGQQVSLSAFPSCTLENPSCIIYST